MTDVANVTDAPDAHAPPQKSEHELLRLRSGNEPLVRMQIAIEGYQLEWLREQAVRAGVTMNRLFRAILDVAIDDYAVDADEQPTSKSTSKSKSTASKTSTRGSNGTKQLTKD